MIKYLKKFWSEKLNKVILILGGLALVFWALSYIWIYFQYGLMLSLAALCFIAAIKFFKKKKKNSYEDFFPQSNNLKENLREERAENSEKISRFFFGIVFILLGCMMIYRFIDFLI